MSVFLCWSKNGKTIAEAFKDFIPRVIQSVTPWMSSDIDKGDRWTPELAEQLKNSRMGIICLTKENLHEDWILFEAGALSNIVGKSHVCTFLYDLVESHVPYPLGQFQHTYYTKDDLKKLMSTIQKVCGVALDKDILDQTFEAFWPEFNNKLLSVQKSNSATTTTIKRNSDEILEEVLGIVRRLAREQQLNYRVLSVLIHKKLKPPIVPNDHKLSSIYVDAAKSLVQTDILSKETIAASYIDEDFLEEIKE